ncbi:TRAP transporter substrate-binding protein DctP [Desulforhopalus singaporensis]|uniref:TRAP-type C4-dicarboxylate transport system, substrate-binding protein n=1 Tax=Desulforhopalus singaporensis TaxID=91360 RepID=A0A1H0VT86_9BACT|nr:TRAP transporter substrate-binding protein DctP [Desulforhopalus singaporensis]SDP81438.1 TRAP-type C4-dicarboxylate transport system, substrate-binding protein [Desulforhopalus singaporensis]
MNIYSKRVIQVFCVLLAGAFMWSLCGFNSEALAAKKLKLNLALESGDKNTAQGKSMQMLADLIEKRSDKKIKVSVFYQGELGGQQEMFDQLVKGNIDMMLTWPQTSYDERLGINYIPYLVLGWQDAMASYGKDGWLKKLIEPVFAEIGLKYFGPYPEGFGGIATKKRYATNFEDAKGLKVRSQPIFPLPQTIKAMGFQPVPIDWSEVYTSIQTGVVDGDSSNVIFWDYEYFRDQLDFYVHSEHNFSSYSLLMNNDKWESLSPEYQKILEDAAMEVINKQFKDAKNEDDKWIKTAQEAGIKYIRPTDEEKLQWVKRVRAEVWPLIEEKLGKEIMDTVREKASVPGQG